jgi:RNA recognition motif-containing protein
MTNRVYVGNIPYSLTDPDLGELFSNSGFTPSRPHILTFRENGRSRGFGFVELASPTEVEEAIRIMDGMNVGGRSIRVSPAIEKENRRDEQPSNRDIHPEPASFNPNDSRQKSRRDHSEESSPRGHMYQPQGYDDTW